LDCFAFRAIEPPHLSLIVIAALAFAVSNLLSGRANPRVLDQNAFI
jgi:hypothetical protein